MADPVSFVASLAGVLQYFRPSRSPYLLPIGIGVFTFLSFVENAPNSESEDLILFYIPGGFALCLMYLFSFRYRLTEFDADLDEEAMDEIENQFKLARATGVAISIFLLFQIIAGTYSHPFRISFWMSYFALISYLTVFVFQMFRNNKQQEVQTNRNVFQIAFSTSFMAIGFSLSGAYTTSDDNSFFYNNCKAVLIAQVSGFTTVKSGNELVSLNLVSFTDPGVPRLVQRPDLSSIGFVAFWSIFLINSLRGQDDRDKIGAK